jgi:hypothetical protein
MPNIVFSLYDIIQISLLLLACFACYKKGHHKGIEDTLTFMEEQGIIETESQDA